MRQTMHKRLLRLEHHSPAGIAGNAVEDGMSSVARCRAEIAGVETQIRAGHPDLQGLCLALADWSCELRLLQAGAGLAGRGAQRKVY
jgi:hypothetical protein